MCQIYTIQYYKTIMTSTQAQGRGKKRNKEVGIYGQQQRPGCGFSDRNHPEPAQQNHHHTSELHQRRYQSHHHHQHHNLSSFGQQKQHQHQDQQQQQPIQKPTQQSTQQQQQQHQHQQQHQQQQQQHQHQQSPATPPAASSYYAGAKFLSPPLPTVLPMPPRSWLRARTSK